MAFIQFQFRRGTSTEWTTANPVLASAEIGVETDTKLFKIGDGTTSWNSLSYGGLVGATGAPGPGNAILASADSSTGTLYPVMAAAAGSTQTPKVDTTSNAFVYNASTKTLNTNKLISTAYYETRVAGGTGGNYTFDLATGNYFSRTVNAASVFSVSNVTSSGTVTAFVLDLTNGGSASITWWSGVKWAGGTAPTLTASGRDILGFFTHDGGTTWNGLVLSKDVK